MKKLGWLAAGLVLTGCSPTVTRTGHPLTPRGEGCAFEVFTIPPEGYAEIGALDIAPGDFSGLPRDIPALQELVAKDVCEMGGDAILPRGTYNRVTVLHRVAGAPAASTASAAAPVAAPAASAADGCHYDTQCKGDRICSGGQCVNPPAK